MSCPSLPPYPDFSIEAVSKMIAVPVGVSGRDDHHAITDHPTINAYRFGLSFCGLRIAFYVIKPNSDFCLCHPAASFSILLAMRPNSAPIPYLLPIARQRFQSPPIHPATHSPIPTPHKARNSTKLRMNGICAAIHRSPLSRLSRSRLSRAAKCSAMRSQCSTPLGGPNGMGFSGPLSFFWCLCWSRRQPSRFASAMPLLSSDPTHIWNDINHCFYGRSGHP